MKTAIAYLRVSTTDQVKHGSSLDNQEDKIRKYCDLNDFDLTEIISDNGVSGKTSNREGFQKVMDIVKNKKTDCVIVYSITRFARNTINTLESIELMNKNDIAFHSYIEKIDTKSIWGKCQLTIISALAEVEVRQISERTKAVLQNKKDRGEKYARVPYGFKEKEGMLIQDTSEQQVINKIFRMRKEKHTYHQIADDLNDLNISSKNGKKWHKSMILYIINNSIYKKAA